MDLNIGKGEIIETFKLSESWSKKKRGQKHLELSFLGRLRGQSHQRVTHLKVLRAGHGEKGRRARESLS